MTRVLKGSHSFTCTPARSSAIGVGHTCLCLPSRGWYSFTDPGGMEGWVDLGAKSEIRTCNLPILQIRHSTTQPCTAHMGGCVSRHLFNSDSSVICVRLCSVLVSELDLRSRSQVQLPVSALQRPWASRSHEPSASGVTTVCRYRNLKQVTSAASVGVCALLNDMV